MVSVSAALSPELSILSTEAVGALEIEVGNDSRDISAGGGSGAGDIDGISARAGGDGGGGVNRLNIKHIRNGGGGRGGNIEGGAGIGIDRNGISSGAEINIETQPGRCN